MFRNLDVYKQCFDECLAEGLFVDTDCLLFLEQKTERYSVPVEYNKDDIHVINIERLTPALDLTILKRLYDSLDLSNLKGVKYMAAYNFLYAFRPIREGVIK